MLDGTKAMRRVISIQIQAPDMSGVNGYKIYRERYQGTELSLIARGVSEDQVESLLSERDYRKFQKGSFRFKVSAQALCNQFQFLL